jgi:drug/metabolite transporter (DMT)-like permease
MKNSSSPLLHITTIKDSQSKPSYLVLLGCLLVLLQLVCQQAQNEMFRYQETNTTFSVPVEGIYMNHSWLVWMLVGAWFICCNQRTKSWYTSPLLPIKRFWLHATSIWKWHELVIRIIILEFIMFVPNVAWTMSLKRNIGVTLSIATQQSQCVFVYFFSMAYFCNNQQNQSQPQPQLNRIRTYAPPFAVFACLFGVFLVCMGESSNGSAGNGNVSNYLLLSINPIFIAIFDLIFSKWSTIICRDTEDVMVLMGMMGIACITCMWPGLFLDENNFQLPSPFIENGHLLYGNAFLATIYNFGFMVGLSIMGPLFISIGAVLQLPLSALTDLIFYHRIISLSTCIGGLLIMGGFLVLTFMGKHKNDVDTNNTDHTNAYNDDTNYEGEMKVK